MLASVTKRSVTARLPFLVMMLFACAPPEPAPEPAPAGAQAAIRAHAGGAVSFGEATLWIPAGSLAADATIGIAALEDVPAGATGAFAATGHAYELTPHGTAFSLAVPAVLSVVVDGAAAMARGLDPRTAQLFHWREESHSYVAVAGAFDERTGSLTASIEHFSKYVVMARSAASTAPGPTVTTQGTVPATIRADSGIYLRATVIPSANTAIASVRAHYRKLQPTPQPWVSAPMQPDYSPAVPGSNTYGTVVPAAFLTTPDLGTGFDLEYYVEATDTLGITTTLAAAPTRRDVLFSYVLGSLTLSPSALTIAAGFQRWLTVNGIDSAGIPYDLVPDATEVSTCPGPEARPIGAIDAQRSSGILFRALRACDGWVSVSSGADLATALISVRAGHLDEIVLYRYEQVGATEVRTRFDGTYAIPEGHALELDAEGLDGFGNSMLVHVAWSADPAIGSVDASGRLHTLDGAGFGQVHADVGDVTASQWFHVLGRAWAPIASPLEPLPPFSTATMPTARADATATLLPNGKVLAAAGLNSAGVEIANADLYDPATNGWTPAAPMGNARYNHTATSLTDGRVLLGGGAELGTWCPAEIYNPTTNTWVGAPSMMRTRTQHTATLLPDGKVLLVGGYVPSSIIQAELYDPAVGSMHIGSNVTTGDRRHTATLLPGGDVVVLGGTNSDHTAAYANASLFASATRTWATLASMVQARHSHTATLLANNRILVTGGRTPTAVLASAERYDPATNTWSPAAAMGSPRYAHTSTRLPDGRVLIAGGHNGTTALSTAELYDPATNQWSALPAAIHPRYAHTATPLANGRVLLTGGRTLGGTIVATAEVVYTSEPAIEPAVALTGSTLYAAWHQPSPAANRVYVKRWTGLGWSQEGSALNLDPAREATSPRLGFAGAVPHVVWRELGAGGAGQIYAKRWDGAAWVQHAAGSLNVAPAQDAASPALAIAGTTPYVAWDEQTAGRRVYVRRWSGTSWSQLGGPLGTYPGLDATRPSLAIAGTTPYVAWEQMTPAGARTIDVHRWTGAAWDPIASSLRVNPAADAREPQLAVAGATVYATWRETLAGVTDIYVAHLASGAWVRDGGSLSNDPSRAIGAPALAFFGTTPYVAWRERSAAGGAPQIFVKHWNGAAWVQDGGSLNADPARAAFAPALVFDGATPYAAWAEESVGRHALRIQRLE